MDLGHTYAFLSWMRLTRFSSASLSPRRARERRTAGRAGKDARLAAQALAQRVVPDWGTRANRANGLRRGSQGSGWIMRLTAAHGSSGPGS